MAQHVDVVSGETWDAPEVHQWGNMALFLDLESAYDAGAGLMRATKAMEIAGVGCVVARQVQYIKDGVAAFDSAMVFVPGVKVVNNTWPDGSPREGRHLEAIA